uniref:Uncharacterized protein n=1 Tax=uncultured marine virus TaxID=186617 RepID=S4TFA3_9VIRU|nr:hypothetical protein [uncultured marine virus]
MEIKNKYLTIYYEMPRKKSTTSNSYYKPKRNFEKSVKTIVQKELSQELEEKNAITEYEAIFLNRNIPSGVVLNGQGNFFKILPEIDQSPTGEAGRAYNTRIGNEINLKSIDLKGYLSYANSNTAQIDYQNAKLAVRVMILRAKEVSDIELLFDNMPTDSLLRFGNQAFGSPSGATNFSGFPLDSFRDINRETFSVRYDKVIYLDSPVILPGNSQPDITVVPSRSKLFSHKLTFGKRGLKLRYSAQPDVNPNNFPYFMVVGYTSMSATGQPDNQLVNMSLSCVGTYTDA